MPFERVPDDLVALRIPMGEPVPEQRSIADPYVMGNALGASFRTGNWLVSGMVNADKTYEPEPKYSPLKDIEGTDYLMNYSDEFLGVQSSAETASIKARIDRRNRDLETVQAAGWQGTVAALGAGLIDPLNLVPGGVVYKGYRAGALAKSALSNAAVFGATAATQEALLSGSQPRTAEDVLFSVGAATLLGGIIGPAASRLMTRAERVAAEQAFDDFARKPLRPAPTGGSNSVGAAAADARQLEPVGMGAVGKAYGKALDTIRKVPVAGKPIAAVLDAPAGLVRNIGPTNRVAYGEFVEARRAMADLTENPGIYYKENLEGLPTVKDGGISVETHAQMALKGGRYRMQKELNGLWSDYYWGNEKVRFGQFKAKVAELTGRADEGKLSFEQFKVEVGKAFRRGDEAADSSAPWAKQVSEAAKTIRRDISEPWKLAAIEAKLLPEDVSVDETAISHLMRLYDNEKIIQERPEFESEVFGYLKETQTHNATLKASIETNLAERQAKERQFVKLEGRIATAQRRHETAESRLSERQMEATATEQRFDTVAARQDEARQSIEDMKTFIADLREADNTPDIRKQIGELEREVKDLESGMTSITGKDLDAIDSAVRKGVLVGPMRKVARIMTGKSTLPKGVQPFWKYVARLGGVKDDGGDLLQRLGTRPIAKGLSRDRNRLFNEQGLQWDDLQGQLAEQFPELQARGYGYAPDQPAENYSDAIREDIIDSVNGKEPAWYVAERGSDANDFVTETVNVLDDLQGRGLVPEFKSMDEFADFMSGGYPGMTEADYDKIAADLDEGPASMDIRVAAVDVRNMANARRETVDLLKDTMAKAKANLGQARAGEGKAGAKVAEAGVAAGRNMRRADILDKRSGVAAVQAELLSAARTNVEKEIEALRLQAEEHLKSWKGKSTAEAELAMAARAEQETERLAKDRGNIARDPLMIDGPWRDETVVVFADGVPAEVKAGPAIDFLNRRRDAVNRFMECIRAS